MLRKSIIGISSRELAGMACGRAEVGTRLFSAEAVSWTKEQPAELGEVSDVSRVGGYPSNVIKWRCCAFGADAVDKVECPPGWRVAGGNPSRFRA